MSAYLVDPEHIHVLVHAASSGSGLDGGMRWCVPDENDIYGYRVVQLHCTAGREELAKVGQMLLDQNAASVNDRYREDNAYVYAYARPKHTSWLPVDVLGALSCYEYQACETRDWRETEAHAFCVALRDKLIHQLPGYRAAPWEITTQSVPAHVQKAEAARAERQAENQQLQARRVEAANAMLQSRVAAGITGPMTSGEMAVIESGTVIPFPTAKQEQPAPKVSERDAAIKAIRQALKRRSGKTWSVRGGRGTAWGWITISAPPARSGDYGGMTDEDAAELGELLGLDGPAHFQGVSIAASSDHRREYIARAEGREPDVHGTPYWD